MTRLYVAGPMTGLPNYNFGAFAEATARLRSQGFDVISPAEHDIEMDWVQVEYDSFGGILKADKREEGAFDWHQALTWDLDAIDRCDGIYLLPGWSKSRGATKEYEHAARTGKAILGAVNERPATPVQHQPLVGLVGYAQSGKDTFAGLLGYHRIAFADALKELAATCHPELRWWVQERGWEWVKAKFPGGREFLQDLGVGVRDVIGPDTWVQAALRKYDPTQPTVITDVRFPNEIEAIKGRGGVIVRIDRQGNGPANGHVSEFAWQSTEPDYRIQNDGDLNDLAASASWLDTILRSA